MFLDAFDATDRAVLVACGEVVRMEPGESLVRAGEPSEGVFYVQHGTLEALNAAGSLLSVAIEGDVIGEVGFLDGAPRSAHVRARTRAIVLWWTEARLRSAFKEHPQLEGRFVGALVQTQSARLRRITDGYLPERAKEIPLSTGTFVPERSSVEREPAAIHLSRIECELLCYLCARPGVTVPYRALLRDVWGYHDAVESRTVYATVHRLRVKIEPDPGSPRHIVSVPGIGYRFDP